MSNTVQIFQSATPKRWTRVKWTTRIILISIAFFVIVAMLAVINATNPSLPNMNEKASTYRVISDPANKFTMSSVENKKYEGFKHFSDKKATERFY